MVFLVAKEDVIKKWAVGGEKFTGYLKWLCMPVFGLVSLFCDVELLKIVDLFLQLNDKANLSADAEVANAEEADSL